MDAENIKEEQLHFLWKHGLLKPVLKTVCGKDVIIESRGAENKYDGPDFSFARIRIADKLWIGNVEIHIKSSDWYKHNHQTDGNYKNIILHVVYDNDKEIKSHTKNNVPTVEIKSNIPDGFFDRYSFINNETKSKIPCKDLFYLMDKFSLDQWLEYLFVDRMEQKYFEIKELLNENENDWEKVFFIKLSESFGLKANKNAFSSFANKIPIKLLRKYSENINQLESLFFGIAGFLEKDMEEGDYGKALQKEFQHLKTLHDLGVMNAKEFKWMRVRPSNYPTIRIAQLASIYHKSQNIFSRVVGLDKLSDLNLLFVDVLASDYWKTHYDFGKESKNKSDRKLSLDFIKLLQINVIIPMVFAWRKTMAKGLAEDQLFLAECISPEKNNIVELFSEIGFKAQNAMQTQALLNLKSNFCDLKKCLNCRIGQKILSR